MNSLYCWDLFKFYKLKWRFKKISLLSLLTFWFIILFILFKLYIKSAWYSTLIPHLNGNAKYLMSSVVKVIYIYILLKLRHHTQECIPVGRVPPAAVAILGEGGLPGGVCPRVSAQGEVSSRGGGCLPGWSATPPLPLPREQNDRCLWKHNLSATTLWTVKIKAGSECRTLHQFHNAPFKST